jgi:pimeloyl-ACP methyl ester carboxylesterase
LDSASNGEGRLASSLRAAAQLLDGNQILERVAGLVAQNFALPNSTPQYLITAMTQLAATGSSAFAAWSANPTTDLTSTLTAHGMPEPAAAAASQQIMSDFNATRQAVRNPAAGIDENSLRAGLRNGSWIAVSAEDDPPEFPVNVAIAPYPQYHVPITVPTPLGGSINISIRCIFASAGSVTLGPGSAQFRGTAPAQPQIPAGDEVVLFLHGEGSKAEEALDFVPALFSVGASAGRSFTVIAFDQPSTAYSTMVPHESVAPPLNVPGPVDTSPPPGSPLLDFVYNAIVTFVETFIVPFGNTITAVVGGSLGGHMALRLAASQKAWVNSVVAWSPACVMDHDFVLGFDVFGKNIGVTESQSLLADHVSAQRATEAETVDASRADFFSTVWDQATFDPTTVQAFAVAAAWLAAGTLSSPIAALGVAAIAGAILALPKVPAQPLMWYRDDWPTGAPTVQLAPWGPAASVGPAKALYIQESRRDRREIYNSISRKWHWRICGEMIRFKFDTLVPLINKPLLLMVGDADNFPEVHFVDNVTTFAEQLEGLGKCLVVQDTGHSIHNERPYFLASQVAAFAPRRGQTP